MQLHDENDLSVDSEIVKGKYDIPHIIKYMGSKKPILDFIVNNIEQVHDETKEVCDVFAGSCSISAALRRKYNFISNDVQAYSKVIAQTYFADYSSYDAQEIFEEIEQTAKMHVLWFQDTFPELIVDFSLIDDLDTFYNVDSTQRNLVNVDFRNIDYFLFTKFYSGTYWSFEQCAWIDSIRKAAENYNNTPIYNVVLSSLMFAMSYTTQSTGHFAQYRDGNTQDAMKNILFYKQKNLLELFKKKLFELIGTLNNSLKTLTTTTADYSECLSNIPQGTTVYADPPYAPVHYSRFYHALETLIRYDYPKIEYKGRYRTDRHQSTFSKKTKAVDAFNDLFTGIINKNAQLLLSYSNNGVLPIDKVFELAQTCFTKKGYILEYKEFNHIHSTMGRFEDSKRDVVEYLIIAKR